MADSALLKAHVDKFKINKDTATEVLKQLFTLHPETAPYYDAEDIDPDMLKKSQKFLQIGMSQTSALFQLARAGDDERQWRSALVAVKEHHDDVGFPIDQFMKVRDALLNALEQHAGGVSDEQRAAWTALFDAAFASFKEKGYIS